MSQNLVSVESQTEHSVTSGKQQTRTFIKMYVDAVRTGLIKNQSPSCTSENNKAKGEITTTINRKQFYI